MQPLVAGAVIMLFIALGEAVARWSRARIPSILVAMLGLLAVVKIGLVPEDVVTISTFDTIMGVLMVPILFHMGTLIPLPTLLAQWRSVLITFGGMLMAVLILAATIIPLFSFAHFVGGAGPLAGGIIATTLTTEGLTKAGVASTVLIVPAMVMMLQSLPAMPLTNFLLRKYAIAMRDSGELERMAAEAKALTEATPHKTPITLPEWMQDNHAITLFIAITGGMISALIAGPTGIPATIVALVLGVAAAAIGLAPDRVLERSNSFGIAMAVTVAYVAMPLLSASLDDILTALLPMLAILVFGGFGIMLGGFIVTKLLKMNTNLGMSVALTAMYGFPADYILTKEVATAVGRNEEEQKNLLDSMLPAMLVGGFASVSAGSVVIASVLVSFL